MKRNVENFARNFLSQKIIPFTARYQWNKKIILTLQLVDKGIIVGYQDFRFPKDTENNIHMEYSTVYFKNITKVAQTDIHKNNRIDNMIDSIMGKKKANTKQIEKISNKLQKTINIKEIDFEYTLDELITTMISVGHTAERIYWMNTSLADARKRRKELNR